ncbi:hypothetical protein Pma05_80580 [Plantactinospora mayteni]|uniref:Uncharacterized protein n=1 Tax=Plantactinospora mayteni TaxID=566021 RepID=A0ABQ4F3J1_9ACTN|nr:hypothetical protein Pma05_80580 [Plantactinospora mayteni]
MVTVNCGSGAKTITCPLMPVRYPVSRYPCRSQDRRRDDVPGGGTRRRVEITLSAPAPLSPYAFRQARAGHLELAARLPAVPAAARP